MHIPPVSVSSDSPPVVPDLSPDSSLRELTLHQFALDVNFPSSELAQTFQQHPELPGVILMADEQLAGVLSRQRFLEYLLLPGGYEQFLEQPLHVLWSYARDEQLILTADTPILAAARQALRRSPRQLPEPIAVELTPFDYRLLDFHQLMLVAWQIRGIETQVRYERSQAQMIQSEKMAALGRLVDGLAHEILDPVGFIWGNLTYLSNYSRSLTELLDVYDRFLPELPPEIIDLQEALDSDYLRQDLHRVVESVRGGAQRLKTLALSLQNFCHIDDVYAKPADLHACLDGILLLLKSRLSSEIEIIRHYDRLPPVTCYIGKLSQVFMNILTNAVDALLNEAVTRELTDEFKTAPLSRSRKPTIEITTQIWARPSERDPSQEERFVSIRIADNGPGMTAKQQRQIRESFSVETRAAKETSLAVSYYIVTAKHGGEFKLRSQPGAGTEFEILLPLS